MGFRINKYRSFYSMGYGRVFESFSRMGINEMFEVLKLNSGPTIEKNVDKLIFYYGSTDPWTPKIYFDQMKARFPLNKIFLDTERIAHAFVLYSSEKMAQILTEMIINERK